jgi:hypothetical protein
LKNIGRVRACGRSKVRMRVKVMGRVVRTLEISFRKVQWRKREEGDDRERADPFVSSTTPSARKPRAGGPCIYLILGLIKTSEVIIDATLELHIDRAASQTALLYARKGFCSS